MQKPANNILNEITSQFVCSILKYIFFITINFDQSLVSINSLAHFSIANGISRGWADSSVVGAPGGGAAGLLPRRALIWGLCICLRHRSG